MIPAVHEASNYEAIRAQLRRLEFAARDAADEIARLKEDQGCLRRAASRHCAVHMGLA